MTWEKPPEWAEALAQHLHQLTKEIRTMALNLDALTAAVTKFVADQGQLNSDLRAFLAALPPADTTQQAAVDALTAQLDTADSGLTVLDALVKPPVTPTA